MVKKKLALFINGYCGEIVSQFLSGFWPNLEENTVDVYSFCAFPSFIMREDEMYGEMNIYNLPDLYDFDAAIIIANGLDYLDVCNELSKRCVETNTPYIMTGIKTESGHFVMSDNEVGTRQLIESVIDDLGCKDIAFLAGGRNNIDSNIRLSIVREVMNSRGLHLPESDEEDDTRLYYSNWEHQSAADYIHYIVREDAVPEIIICANDELAMVSCVELEEAGYRVPEDVFVTGFDNSYYAKIFSPSISSVDQNYSEVGVACARLIKGIFAGETDLKEIVVQSKYCSKESTGGVSEEEALAIRKNVGKSQFTDISRGTDFSRKISEIERQVLASKCFEEIPDHLKKAYDMYDHNEKDSFHIVLDARYKKSIEEMRDNFKAYEYSDTFDVAYSRENGNTFKPSVIDRHKLVPVIDESDKNRYFLFAPIHEFGYTYGYMILCDDINCVNTKNKVKEYEDNLSVAFGRVVQTLRLNDLNKKLFEISQTDSLTHVKNRNAYDQKEKEYDSWIANNGSSLCFSIGVFDINNLKYINDTYGHEKGDAYILNSCQFLCQAYKHSPVYRIGGDEFVVILTGEDQAHKYEIFNNMISKMDELKNSDESIERKVSIAGGFSDYDPDFDKTFSEVFKRADSLMYLNKSEMKAKRN